MSHVDPIHVATIDGVAVRFFEPPPGRHEAPWIALIDLHAALGFSPDDVPRVTEVVELIPDGTDRATALTAKGPAIIVSHTIAYSFIAGAVQGGIATLAKAAAYGSALSEAIDRALANLPPMERDRLKHTWLSDTFGLESAPLFDADPQRPN